MGAAYYGGNIGSAMLKGAGIGAVGGAAFGGIGGYYGKTWNLRRVGSYALAGGGVSELAGQGFENGAMFALALAISAWTFDSVVGEAPNPEPGKDDVYKAPNALSRQESQNVGIAVPDANTQIEIYHEHHPLMKAIGKYPLMNAFATFHDNMQVKWHIPEAAWYAGIGYGPSHIFALGVTYAAYSANNSPYLWQSMYFRYSE